MMNAGTTSVGSALMRQLTWSTGRIFTYSFLGMLAGFAGARLSRSEFLSSQTNVVTVQAAFAILAGLLLIVQGVIAAGWLRLLPKSTASCLAASVFRKFLQSGSTTSVFIAGLLTGFLPCGLVYSFLALAAASSSLWKGPLLMLAFGLGTFPVMLVTGAGLTMASLKLRQRLMKLAAVCVVVTGLLTVGRGLSFASFAASASTSETPAQACPFCEAVKS